MGGCGNEMGGRGRGVVGKDICDRGIDEWVWHGWVWQENGM